MIPRIREVFIENYKSIEKARVTLEPFTVLVGANGSGKSNFVDALSFVNDCIAESVEDALKRRGPYWHVFSQFGETGVPPVRFRLDMDLGRGGKAIYSFALGEEPPGTAGVAVLNEQCIVHKGKKKHRFEVKDGQLTSNVDGLRPVIATDRLALPLVAGVGEFRHVYDFMLNMRFYCIDPNRLHQENLSGEQAKSLRKDGSNAAAVLLRMQEETESQGRLERILRLLPIISSGIKSVNVTREYNRLEYNKLRLDDKLRVVDLIDDRARYALSFVQEIAGHWIPRKAAQMSDGTLSALGVLLAAYQTGGHSVVAIEEPEATIHPAAAEVLYQALMDASHDRQILIVTHSPDILNQKDLSSENIRVVVMEHGRTFIAPVSEGAREAIRKKLYMPGELLQMNELDADITAAKKLADSSSDA